LKLPGSYLFSEVGKRAAKFQKENPDAKIIRLGIGDVTRPLPQVCIDAMKRAADEMGKVETFRGYGPEQGYAFLRDKIADFNYKRRGLDVSADEIFISDGKIFRKTNRAGGFEGGMTNGEDLIIRAAMKPIPTLMKPLQTVDIATKLATTASKERSDTCAIWAAEVVGEAMAAIVTADAFTEKFSGDALCDTLANLKFYRERLKKDFGL